MAKKKSNSDPGCFAYIFGITLLACILALIYDLLSEYAPNILLAIKIIIVIIIILIFAYSFYKMYKFFKWKFQKNETSSEVKQYNKQEQVFEKINGNKISNSHDNIYLDMPYEELRALPEYSILCDYISKQEFINTDKYLKESPFNHNVSIAVLAYLTVVEKKLYKGSNGCFYYIKNNDILSMIDNMSSHGLDFERFSVELLSKNGFKNVKQTQGSGDYGIDVLAEKDGITYAIQCKCYSSTVGNKAIQEAYSGKDFYKCMVAVVFTNNYFTKAAVETAKQNNVLLWDRDKLIEFLKKAGY